MGSLIIYVTSFPGGVAGTLYTILIDTGGTKTVGTRYMEMHGITVMHIKKITMCCTSPGEIQVIITCKHSA